MFPCDFCNERGVVWVAVPRKRWRIKKERSVAALKMPFNQLWVCRQHEQKMKGKQTHE